VSSTSYLLAGNDWVQYVIDFWIHKLARKERLLPWQCVVPAQIYGGQEGSCDLSFATDQRSNSIHGHWNKRPKDKMGNCMATTLSAGEGSDAVEPAAVLLGRLLGFLSGAGGGGPWWGRYHELRLGDRTAPGLTSTTTTSICTVGADELTRSVHILRSKFSDGKDGSTLEIFTWESLLSSRRFDVIMSSNQAIRN
jgi:hypothetical protein